MNDDSVQRRGGERRPGRSYSARFHLLDRQVVADDATSVSKVDDLELIPDEHGRPCVTALLIGPAALAPRLGGRPARWLSAVAHRLSTGKTPGPARIDIDQITHIGATLTVSMPDGGLGVHALEDWTRDNLIARLPGSGHAPG